MVRIEGMVQKSEDRKRDYIWHLEVVFIFIVRQSLLFLCDVIEDKHGTVTTDSPCFQHAHIAFH